MVVYKIVTSQEDVESLAQGWRELHQRMGMAPFTDYDFAMAWWNTVGKPAGAQLMVAVCHEGDRLVGVIPFSIRKKAAVRILRLLGHEVYYYRNFLVEEPDAIAEMWKLVFKQKTYDFADIKNIHLDTAEDAFFAEHACRLSVSLVYHAELHTEGRKEMLARFSRPFRRKLTCAKRDMDAQGHVELGISCEHPVPLDVIDFLVARKTAWTIEKGKRGIFDEANPLALYQEMARIGADKKKLVLCWMRHDGAPVGVTINFVEKGVLYGHTLAYDALVARFSPGIYLNTEAMSWASEKGLHEKNFMEGEEPYKSKFAKHTRVIHEYAWARTPLGWAFFIAYRVLCLLRKFRNNRC